MLACMRRGILPSLLPLQFSVYSAVWEVGVILTHRTFILFCVPPIRVALAKQGTAGKYDISSLKFICLGVGPLGKEVLKNALQNRLKPLIDEAIKDLCTSTNTLCPQNMLIADLGCASGPNAITLVSMAIEAIANHCIQFKQTPPEVCVLLNDLPTNDFNTVVKSLVTLQGQRNMPVFVTIGITPGSFYERLFTSGSLHLFCSSNSLNWLSEAPGDLTRNGVPAYDVDDNARNERLPMVAEAYAHQFRKDFTHFLELRAKELVPRGRMIISLVGKHSDDRTSKFSHMWEMFAKILSVMASEDVIDKAKFNSFYVPLYGPTDDELRGIIEKEGSFSISDMQVHDRTSSLNNPSITPRWLANQLRAAFEPIVVQHFGEVMDEFVRTAERRWSLEGCLEEEIVRYPRAQLVVSLTKKA